MNPEHNLHEQNRKLEQMDYDPKEDLFNQESHISLDGDGNPLLQENAENDKIDGGLDIPGSEADDPMEETGAEDEENNYWSLSDNNDDHEEVNDDVL